MEEILHHLAYTKPCKSRDIFHMNWCRISSINSSWKEKQKWPRFMFPTAKSWGQIPTIEVGFPQRATFPIRISFVSLFHSFLFKFHPSPLIIFPTGFYSDSLRLPQIPQEIRRTSQLYPFALQGLREMIAISLGQEIQCGTFPCILPAKGSDWVEEGIGSPSGSNWG